MKKIKLTDEQLKIFNKYVDYAKSEEKTQAKGYTETDIKGLFLYFGIPEQAEVDIMDYIDFYKAFGNNYKLYIKYKPFKEERNLSWKKFKLFNNILNKKEFLR